MPFLANWLSAVSITAIFIFSRAITNPRVLEDSIIKDGSYNIDRGVGVRAVSGEKTGFAYADQISKLALEQSARAARTIVRDHGDGKVQTLGAVEYSSLYQRRSAAEHEPRRETGYPAPR